MQLVALLIGFILCTVPVAEAVDGLSRLSTSFEVQGEELARVRVATARRGERSILPSKERQIQFEAFNETFDLNLVPAGDLLSPRFSVLLRKNDEKTEEIPSEQFSECFYRGPNAAFNLCQGLRGIVTLSANEFLSVEPKSWHAKDDEVYLIKRMAWKAKHSQSIENVNRKKRSLGIGMTTKITVETAIFIDAYLYKHMAQENFPDDVERKMTHFVLTMMNAVQLLYQDESLGYDIHFQVQRLEMWPHQPADLMPSQAVSSFSIANGPPKKGIYDIDRYLNRFCHWQSRRNPPGDQDPNHWDHALLLTGLDLFALGRDGVTSHQIVGLAPIGGMCTSTSSCTVNEGRHFESVYVVAHEIGHNLGMKHDGRDAGNDCDSGSFVMSPTLGTGKTQWSPCSRHYLDSFLNTPQAACLFDSSWIPERLDHNSSGILPGERYSADEQCMMRHGKESKRSPQTPLNEICRDLRCTKSPRRVSRQTSSGISQYTSHPALEGTPCGDNMWCRRGRCTARPNFEEDINYHSGNSQSWMTTNPCASGCLYGEDSALSTGSMAITTQVQTCKSGASCNSGAIRYQTCDGSQVCAQINRTTIQQYTDEICARASQQNSSILARGLQQTSADGMTFRSCQVWCYLRSGGLMSSAGWVYPDGTRCQTTHDTKHYGGHLDGTSAKHFCIAGRCQEFSCDEQSPFKLHSSLCRQEDPAESNLIYDYPVESTMVQRPSGGKISSLYMDNQLQDLLSPPSTYRERITTSQRDRQSAYDKPKPYTSNGLLVDSLNPITFNASRFTRIVWKPVSSCRSSCLTSSKGLRLVRRDCHSSYCDSDQSNNNVQLCIPNEQECPHYQPISSFANQVCQHQLWSDQHRGFQIWSPTQSDGACAVHCRDKRTHDLLPVQGEAGWFPSGTLCDRRRSAYCVSGRCLEFDELGVAKRA